LLLYKLDAQRAREHFKAFAGLLELEVETISFANGRDERSAGKWIARSPVFWFEPGEKVSFRGKKRDFPVIFGAESHHAGGFGSQKFSTGIDSKRVKNNLQGFEGNLHSLLEGGGVSGQRGTDRAHP
jgi:hypothetical protein